MKTDKYSRRALLKGMGVGLGMLPMLNSERVVAATGGVAKRFISITWTNGTVPADYYPAAGPLTGTLPAILQPLDMWKSKILSIRGKTQGGIDSKVGVDAGQTFGGHSNYPSLLTGTWQGGTASIDNLINDSFKTAGYSSPPLTLGCRPGSSTTSWKAGKVKNSSETDPYRLYTRLFAGISATPAPAGMPATAMADPLLARRKSVIDKLIPDLTNFANRLGSDDKAKINAHLDSIRAIELQLTSAPAVPTGAGCKPPPNTPAGLTFGNNNNNFPNQVKLMTDIMAAAVKCDLARTMTLDLIDDGGGNSLTFPTLNISSPDYHAIAHASAKSYAQKTQIETLFFTQVANLVGQLASNPEGSSTSLDNSVILICNDMNEGGNHDVRNLPYLIIGSGGGFFKQGVCVQMATNAPNNQLLTSICHAMGLMVTSVGTTYTGDLDSMLKA